MSWLSDAINPTNWVLPFVGSTKAAISGGKAAVDVAQGKNPNGGTGGNQTLTIANAGPSQFQLPWINKTLGAAQNQYLDANGNIVPRQVYTGPTVAPLTQQQQMAIQSGTNLATNILPQLQGQQQNILTQALTGANSNPLSTAGNQLLPQLLANLEGQLPGFQALPNAGSAFSGVDITNPNVGSAGATIQQALDQARQQLELNILPQLTNQDVAAGQYGGTRGEIARGVAGGLIGQGFADTAAKAIQDQLTNQAATTLAAQGQQLQQAGGLDIANQNNVGNILNLANLQQSGILNQSQIIANILAGGTAANQNYLNLASGIVPQIAQTASAPAQILSTVGGLAQGQTQNELTAAQNTFNQQQQAPIDALQQFAQLVYGVPQPSTSQTATQSFNPLQQLLQGGVGTGLAATALGASNPWLWALGGGLAGMAGA